MRSTPLIPWLYAHDPKFAEAAANDAYADPALPRPVSEYMKEIIEQGIQPIRPKPEDTLFVIADDVVMQLPAADASKG